MNPQDLLRAVRRSWWLVVLILAICTGAAAAYTAHLAPKYASHTQLFVAAQPPRRPDLQATYQGGLFTTQRVQSYARIATSPLVTAPVIRRLKLHDTPSSLGARITASAPPDTVLIDLTVTDSSAAQAQKIADGIGYQFAKTVEQLERPTRDSDSPVRLSPSVPATHPSAAISPRKKLSIGAGAVLGLLLGLLAAGLRWRLDTRITSPAGLPSGHGTALLGSVPFDRDAGLVPTVGLRKTALGRAEALRQLRTNLRFVDPDHPPETIVVTSALPGEGKTTTAVGLAMAMADAGVAVILVEGDLRKPWLAEYLGISPNEGVAGHLVTGRPVDELLQGWPAGMEGGSLRVLTAGPVPPNPSELLGSQRMKDLLAELRSRCDIVLIDAPPVLPVADATLLATEADGVLVVARMGKLTRPQLGRALEALSRVHARILGFVANGVPAGAGYGDGGTWSAPPATLPPAPPLPPSSSNGRASTAGHASW